LKVRLDKLTIAVVAAGVVMLNALLFIAGAIIGTIPEAEPASQPPVPVVQAKQHQQPATSNPQPVVAASTLPLLIAPPLLNVPHEPLLRDAAQRHRLSPVLLAAVTRVESDFDPHSHSHKNARGLMQVIPETGKRFGVGPEELFIPERNIAAGSAYLSWLLDRYKGDVDLALAAYNAGEGAVDKYRGIPPYRETRDYVKKVRKAFLAMQGRASRN
jgi:soluble lytic murein transglycosylase-like protein